MRGFVSRRPPTFSNTRGTARTATSAQRGRSGFLTDTFAASSAGTARYGMAILPRRSSPNRRDPARSLTFPREESPALIPHCLALNIGPERGISRSHQGAAGTRCRSGGERGDVSAPPAHLQGRRGVVSNPCDRADDLRAGSCGPVSVQGCPRKCPARPLRPQCHCQQSGRHELGGGQCRISTHRDVSRTIWTHFDPQSDWSSTKGIRRYRTSTPSERWRRDLPPAEETERCISVRPKPLVRNTAFTDSRASTPSD